MKFGIMLAAFAATCIAQEVGRPGGLEPRKYWPHHGESEVSELAATASVQTSTSSSSSTTTHKKKIPT